MEGRGGGCEVAKVLHAKVLQTYRLQTDPLTNRVVEQLSLLKKLHNLLINFTA